MYVAQAIPQIDKAGAEKSPFRTETDYWLTTIRSRPACLACLRAFFTL